MDQSKNVFPISFLFAPSDEDSSKIAIYSERHLDRTNKPILLVESDRAKVIQDVVMKELEEQIKAGLFWLRHNPNAPV